MIVISLSSRNFVIVVSKFWNIVTVISFERWSRNLVTVVSKFWNMVKTI